MLKHIVCSDCLATNRVPNKRLFDSPSCGKCHQILLKTHAIDVDYKTFMKMTKKSDLTMIVDFWAEWCGPCKSMAPIFNQTALDLIGQYILIKVNTEKEQHLSGSLGIRSIPTLIAFKKGKEVNRVSGALQKPQLMQWIQSC